MDSNGHSSELSPVRPYKKPGPASKTMNNFYLKKTLKVGRKGGTGDHLNKRGHSSSVQQTIANPVGVMINGGGMTPNNTLALSFPSYLENPTSLNNMPLRDSSVGPGSVTPVSNASNSHSWGPDSGISLGNRAVKKTECLLCTDIVNRFGEFGSATSATNKYEAIKTLCRYLQMNQVDFPHQYSEEMFPFCLICRKLIEQIAESDKIIQTEQRKISKCISDIQRAVADSEILKFAPNPYASQDVRFTKLRETTLEGYRNKLMMKKKIRERRMQGENIVDVVPELPHTVRFVDKHNQLEQATQGVLQTQEGEISIKDVRSISSNEVVELNANVNFIHTSPSFLQDAVLDSGDSSDSVSVASEVDVVDTNGGNGEQNHVEIDIDINERSQSENQSRSLVLPTNGILADTETSSIDVSPVIIKQEVSSTPPTPNLDSPQNNVVKRRRSIFRGIDIYKVSSPGNSAFLECGVCGHSVEIKQSTVPSASAYQSMTAHISNDHFRLGQRSCSPLIKSQNKPESRSPANNERKIRTRENLSCSKCSKTFKTFGCLTAHIKEKHPDVHAGSFASQITTRNQHPKQSKDSTTTSSKKKSLSYFHYECDICGRPIYNTPTSFLGHKFSHKNQKEKIEAILSREKGAPSARSYKKSKSLSRNNRRKRAM